MEKSYFDGKLHQYFGYAILTFFIVLLTLGLGTPWAVCIMKSWETKHMVIDGKRLTFDGKGSQLFGSFIKWWFFLIITLGIYGFWLNIAMKEWLTKHTHFQES